MKKKVIVSLLFALCLLLGMTAAAHADAQIDYVSDYAGLLSDTQRRDLNDRAAEIADEYNFGVFVVVVNDYKSYVNGSIADFSEEVFHRYGLGRGQKEEGVLLAMSMNDRDYDIYAHGDFGNYAFTDYGKDQLANSFLDDFRRNDWAGGFRGYLETSAVMLQKAEEGSPVDTFIPDPVERPRFNAVKAMMCLALGTLFGGGAVGTMKRSMKTAVKQTRAENYVGRGGVTLRTERDEFLNRSVTRTRIMPQNTGPSGGRPGGGHFGGTTISGSHGGSHHSGKF